MIGQLGTSNAPELPRGRLLFAWLLILTTYRLWIVPHLGITLYVDEAQYWTWAKDLDWGYFSKPPLIGWLIAATTLVFGDGVLAVKLAGMLCYPATAWVVFLLGRQLFDERIGLRCAIAFSLLPFVSGLGLFVSTDAPLLFCWALAVLALSRALALDRWRDWLLLGLAVGLGALAKYTMLAFGACALLYLLAEGERRRQLGNPRLWAAIGTAGLLLLPNILWNWANDFPTLHHTADITHVDGSNDKDGNLGEFLLGQVLSLGPLLALAFLASMVVFLRKLRDSTLQLLHAFALPLLGLVLLQALRSEANSNWAAPAFITATVLAVHWLSRFKTRWWLCALVLNATIMLLAYHATDAYRWAGESLPQKLDLLKRTRGWPQLAQQLRPILAAHPDAIVLADTRTLAAHMRYELRDMRTEFMAWKPQARPQDHYQLTVPLEPSNMARRIILITQDIPEPIAQRFASQQRLAYLTVQGASFRREMSVVLLTGFRGYP